MNEKQNSSESEFSTSLAAFIFFKQKLESSTNQCFQFGDNKRCILFGKQWCSRIFLRNFFCVRPFLCENEGMIFFSLFEKCGYEWFQFHDYLKGWNQRFLKKILRSSFPSVTHYSTKIQKTLILAFEANSAFCIVLPKWTFSTF